jgi:hypothetical protein
MAKIAENERESTRKKKIPGRSKSSRKHRNRIPNERTTDRSDGDKSSTILIREGDDRNNSVQPIIHRVGNPDETLIVTRLQENAAHSIPIHL